MSYQVLSQAQIRMRPRRSWMRMRRLRTLPTLSRLRYLKPICLFVISNISPTLWYNLKEISLDYFNASTPKVHGWSYSRFLYVLCIQGVSIPHEKYEEFCHTGNQDILRLLVVGLGVLSPDAVRLKLPEKRGLFVTA